MCQCVHVRYILSKIILRLFAVLIWVNDFSFLACSSLFLFLLIEFHYTFSISYRFTVQLQVHNENPVRYGYEYGFVSKLEH